MLPTLLPTLLPAGSNYPNCNLFKLDSDQAIHSLFFTSALLLSNLDRVEMDDPKSVSENAR